MSSPSSGALRYVRAACLTVAVLGLSLSAHVVAGGHAPSRGLTAALALVVFWACTVLTWRRLGPVTITAVLVVSQLLLHGCFEFLGGASACVELVHAHAGHLTQGSTIVCPDPMPGMGAGMSHGDVPGWGMVAAHALAAVLLGLLLAGGERALWSLTSLVWRPLPARCDVQPTRGRAPVAASVATLPLRLLPVGGVGRRGPPGWSAAVS